MSQTLDESMWCDDALITFDLVASTMTDSEQAFVEHNLLRAIITTVKRNDKKETNWQSWHNSAIGGVGFLFEDIKLINESIYGSSGFKFQMQVSMMDDGMWYESSLGKWSIW